MKSILISERREHSFGNLTIDMNQLLRDERKNIELKFEKGAFCFDSQYAYEEYAYITNNDHGLKRVAFPIFDCENLVVDGNGSTFVFCGRIIPFFLRNSKNVVLKNFTIDVKRPYFSQGIIVESSKEHVVIDLDKRQYPYVIKDGKLIFTGLQYESDFVHEFIEFEREEKKPVYGCEDFFVDDCVTAEVLDNGYLKIYHTFHREPMVGKVLVIKHEKRLIPGIVADHSENVTFENVTIRQAGTMGIVVQYSKDLYLNNVTVGTDEMSERVVSTNTDATHFVGCTGKVVVENCRFESQLDDAINVHGNYLIMDKQVSDNQVIAKIGHYQQQGIFGLDKGTTINILDAKTMLSVAGLVLENKRILNREYVLLTFNKKLELDETCRYCIEDVDRYPEVIFRNNIIRKNRARGMLLTSRKKILVENNKIVSESAAIKISGDTEFWFESGPITDVLIRNNVIESVNNNEVWGTALFDFDPEMDECLENKYYHGTIVIENNEIIQGERPLIFGQNIHSLRFTDNKYKQKPNDEDYQMTHCGSLDRDI